MNLQIEMRTSKDKMLFDTGVSAKECVKCNDRDYLFKVSFDIFASKAEIEGSGETGEISEKDKLQVGEIVATFIDEVHCLNDGVDILEIADVESEDCYNTILKMQDTREYEKLSIDKEWQPLLTVYMDIFYIYPEYRNKGIGTYLLANLGDIFEIFTNRVIHAVGVYLKPLCLRGETMTEEEDAVMLRKMQKHYNRAGFKKIGNTRYYMRNYAAE